MKRPTHVRLPTRAECDALAAYLMEHDHEDYPYVTDEDHARVRAFIAAGHLAVFEDAAKTMTAVWEGYHDIRHVYTWQGGALTRTRCHTQDGTEDADPAEDRG